MNKKLIMPLFLFLLVFFSCSGEKRDWKNAESENSITAYEDFLKQYPQGEFADEARSKIETIYFEKAAATNTIDAYDDFLNRYSEGEFADKARFKIEAIYFNQAKAADSIEAYKDFLEKYPEGEFTNQARQMLEKIYPSFSKERVLIIESISSIVGTGEIYFTKGSKPSTLKITASASTPIVNGSSCMHCAALIRIAPNLKVPTLFFKATKMKLSLDSIKLKAKDNDAIESYVKILKASGFYAEKDLDILGQEIERASEFIVSGLEGATLKKEGNGFRLIEGEARFLKRRTK